MMRPNQNVSHSKKSITHGVPLVNPPLSALNPAESYDAIRKDKPVIIQFPSQGGGGWESTDQQDEKQIAQHEVKDGNHTEKAETDVVDNAAQVEKQNNPEEGGDATQRNEENDAEEEEKGEMEEKGNSKENDDEENLIPLNKKKPKVMPKTQDQQADEYVLNGLVISNQTNKPVHVPNEIWDSLPIDAIAPSKGNLMEMITTLQDPKFNITSGSTSSSSIAEKGVVGKPSQNTALLIWFPGANQNPDNEILRRFTNAFHAIGGAGFHTIHATTYKLGEDTVDYYLMNPEKRIWGGQKLPRDEEEEAGKKSGGGHTSGSGSPIFVGGHSMGAGIAARLASKYKLPCILFGTGPPATPPGLYCLTVLGEYDGDGANFIKKNTHSSGGVGRKGSVHSPKITVVKNHASSILLVPHRTDHSIRTGPKGGDKQAVCFSKETLLMTEALAQYIRAFVEAFCVHQPLC